MFFVFAIFLYFRKLENYKLENTILDNFAPTVPLDPPESPRSVELFDVSIISLNPKIRFYLR